MQKLTKAEENIMHRLWNLGKSTVTDIIKSMPDPHPPHSTVSTTIRILEKKGFVSHETYGRTHAYYPVITKEKYSKKSIKDMIHGYFDGSVENMLSFLIKEEKVDKEELKKLVNQLENEK